MYYMTWSHKDTINDYNNLIAEFQKLYEATPQQITLCMLELLVK
jgi:hypothetical protein